MTPDQLHSLDWAIHHLGTLFPDAPPEEFTTLLDLTAAAKLHHFALSPAHSSLVAFMAKHELTLPTAEFDSWRMIRPLSTEYPLVGSIPSLPSSRGVLRATNGILCWIERADGGVFEGHLQFFIPDPHAKPPVIRTCKPGTALLGPKMPTDVVKAKRASAAQEEDVFAAMMALP